MMEEFSFLSTMPLNFKPEALVLHLQGKALVVRI